MLATLVREPFDRPEWIYEEKYDGDRIIAYKEGKRVRLLSRDAIDRTAQFPHIAAQIQSLEPRSLLLDGEVVVFDSHGVSRFQILQQRKGAPVYAVFDCLYRDGEDLRAKPLSARRAVLEQSIDSARLLAPSKNLAENGFDAYRIAEERGYEGLVAKNLTSPYQAGRSSDWLKVKTRQEDEFIIVGFTQPAGTQEHFGALLLGAYEDSKLRYVGKVGTGFNGTVLASLRRKFTPLIRKQPPLADPVDERTVTFLEPRLVAQIAYQEWTVEMKLRQPVFLGLRTDKKPREVTLPKSRDSRG